jgi:hypothetical protein
MAVLGSIFIVLVSLGTSPHSTQTHPGPDTDPTTHVSYIFSSPNLYIVRAELEFNELGKGTYRFLKKEEEESLQLPLQLLPATVEQINRMLEEIQFLTSREEYQGDRNHSHLGTVSLRVRRGGREREVSFNYTTNRVMRELAALLRGITSQENRVFAIDLARRHEPLALDREMQALQREVHNGWLAEPLKLLPLLQDLRSDEAVLLMARRRAEELIQKIRKKG